MFAAFLISFTQILHSKDVFEPPLRRSTEQWQSGGSADPRPGVLSFASSDGTILCGWRFGAAKDQPFILFFYGSNEDVFIERQRLLWLSEHLKVNAVAFDYRGYGFSDGRVEPELIRSDSLAAFDTVKKLAGDSPVIAYGWSVGADIAVHVAAARPVDGLILQAPPASATEMATASRAHDVPWAVRWAVKLRHDLQAALVFQGREEIRHAPEPLLILEGSEDRVVPQEQATEVLEASAAIEKRIVIVPGAHHNDLRISAPPASLALEEFVAKFVH